MPTLFSGGTVPAETAGTGTLPVRLRPLEGQTKRREIFEALTVRSSLQSRKQKTKKCSSPANLVCDSYGVLRAHSTSSENNRYFQFGVDISIRLSNSIVHLVVVNFVVKLQRRKQLLYYIFVNFMWTENVLKSTSSEFVLVTVRSTVPDLIASGPCPKRTLRVLQKCIYLTFFQNKLMMFRIMDLRLEW